MCLGAARTHARTHTHFPSPAGHGQWWCDTRVVFLPVLLHLPRLTRAVLGKAILESSARGKELGPITLNLPFVEPLWKLLLGHPLGLTDLQQLDPTEFRSLMSLLDMDIDGLIFETFTWAYHHQPAALPQPPLAVSATGFGVGAGYVPPAPPGATAGAAPGTPRGGGVASASNAQLHSPKAGGGDGGGASGGFDAEAAAGGAEGPSGAMGGGNAGGLGAQHSVNIPLKPGGNHLKVCACVCAVDKVACHVMCVCFMLSRKPWAPACIGMVWDAGMRHLCFACPRPWLSASR